MRIGILGAGGVGATVAGAVVKDKNAEIVLIARGETKENVLKRGWILESEVLENQIIHPALVSDDPAEIGTVDVLVLACKSYSLKDVCDRYSSIVRDDTLVIPLQNGFMAAQQAQEALGKGQIAHGFIYCLSKIVEKGKVVNVGTLLRAGFSFPDGRKNERAKQLAAMMQAGGLPTIYTADILEDSQRMTFLKGTYDDLYRLAEGAGVHLPEDIRERYLQEFAAMPLNSTSSLYRDIKDGVPQNELEQIVGNAVRLAREKKISVPFIAAAYDKTLQTML